MKYLVTEYQHSPEWGNVHGYTPLHLAASNGQLEVVKYLISELGCNPHITTNDGHTPLHCAHGHPRLNAKYLIPDDCNCNPKCHRSKQHVPDGRAEVANYLTTEHRCSLEQDATMCKYYSSLTSATINGDAIQDFGGADTNKASGMTNGRKNDPHASSKVKSLNLMFTA